MRFLAALLVTLVLSLETFGFTTVNTWDIDISKYRGINVTIRRGESVDLVPVYLRGTNAVSLAGFQSVILRYKPTTTNEYPWGLAGIISNNMAVFSWSSSNCVTNAVVDYEVALISTNQTMLRAFGRFYFDGWDNFNAYSPPSAPSLIDWQATTNLNVESAPFATDAQLDALGLSLTNYVNAREHAATNSLRVYIDAQDNAFDSAMLGRLAVTSAADRAYSRTVGTAVSNALSAAVIAEMNTRSAEDGDIRSALIQTAAVVSAYAASDADLAATSTADRAYALARIASTSAADRVASDAAYIKVNGTSHFTPVDPASPTTGQVWYSEADATLNFRTRFDSTISFGMEGLALVWNDTGALITNGTPVYIAQAHAAGEIPAVAPAYINGEFTENIIGLATVDIPNHSEGLVCSRGIVRGINTASWAVSNLLYLSRTAGVLTNAKLAGADNVCVGIVTRSHANTGKIYVWPHHESYHDSDTSNYMASVLGSAAFSNASDFASAAQGALASTALQPASTNSFEVGSHTGLLDLAGPRAMTGNSVTLARETKSRDATSVGGYGAAFGLLTVAGTFGEAFGFKSTAGDYGASFGDESDAGNYGAAFGRQAKGGIGSFIFSDGSSATPFDRSAFAYEFGVRAHGGMYVDAAGAASEFVGPLTASSFTGAGTNLTLLNYAPSLTDTVSKASTALQAASTNGTVYTNTLVYTQAVARSTTAWQNPIGATNWTWTSDGKVITITGYTGPNAVVIPEMLDGLPVRNIPQFVFANTGITSVSIPPTVRSIPGSCFANCASLTSVTLSPGLESIGEYAFQGCAFTAIALPETLKTIDVFAFYTAALTAIRIPAGVMAIPDGAFSGCASLATVVIGDGVTSIGEGAFANTTAMASLTLGKSTKTIAFNAFSSTAAIAEVFVPSSVTSIGGFGLDYDGLTRYYFEGDQPTFPSGDINDSGTATAYVMNATASWPSTPVGGLTVVRLPVSGAITNAVAATNAFGYITNNLGTLEIGTNNVGASATFLVDQWTNLPSVNNVIFGSGSMYLTDVGGTSTLYHITSGNVTNLVGTFFGR